MVVEVNAPLDEIQAEAVQFLFNLRYRYREARIAASTWSPRPYPERRDQS